MLATPEATIETVLVVSPSMNRSLSGILEGVSCPLTVLHSSDCEQALAHLTESMISVVICEALLPDGKGGSRLYAVRQMHSLRISML